MFKIWLKIQRVCLCNFGASGIMLTKLFQATCRESGAISWVQFLEGLSLKIWKGQKPKSNKNLKKFGF